MEEFFFNRKWKNFIPYKYQQVWVCKFPILVWKGPAHHNSQKLWLGWHRNEERVTELQDFYIILPIIIVVEKKKTTKTHPIPKTKIMKTKQNKIVECRAMDWI